MHKGLHLGFGYTSILSPESKLSPHFKKTNAIEIFKDALYTQYLEQWSTKRLPVRFPLWIKDPLIQSCLYNMLVVGLLTVTKLWRTQSNEYENLSYNVAMMNDLMRTTSNTNAFSLKWNSVSI